MTFVTSQVGLWSISNLEQTNIFDKSTLFSLPEDLLQLPIAAQIKSSLDVASPLWEFTQDTFYRSIRRCVEVVGLQYHRDLMADHSHHVWLGLTSRLFELAQIQRARVWDFGSKLQTLIGLISLLSSPSVYIDSTQIDSIRSSVELCVGAIPQFTSFLGTSYQDSLLSKEVNTHLDGLTSATHQITSEAALLTGLKHLSGDVRKLQHSLAAEASHQRVSLQLVDAFHAVLSQIDERLGSEPKFIFGQSGVPMSVRRHLFESVSRVKKSLNPLLNLKSQNAIAVDANLTECLNSVVTAFESSTDWVS